MNLKDTCVTMENMTLLMALFKARFKFWVLLAIEKCEIYSHGKQFVAFINDHYYY